MSPVMATAQTQLDGRAAVDACAGSAAAGDRRASALSTRKTSALRDTTRSIAADSDSSLAFVVDAPGRGVEEATAVVATADGERGWLDWPHADMPIAAAPMTSIVSCRSVTTPF